MRVSESQLNSIMCLSKSKTASLLIYIVTRVFSDVVVNCKTPRLFFTGDIGDIQHLQVGHASEGTVPNEGGKEKVWRGFVSRY